MAIKFVGPEKKSWLPKPGSVDYTDHLTPTHKGTVGKGKVEVVTKANGNVSSSEEETKMASKAIPLAELCHVQVGGRSTINLGNYNSAQIMVSVTLPCARSELDEAYSFASEWVSGKMEEAVNSAKEGV